MLDLADNTSDEQFLMNLLPIGIVKTNLRCEIIDINNEASEQLAINQKPSDLLGNRLTDIVDNVQLLNKLWSFTQESWTNTEIENIKIDNKNLKITGQVHGEYYYLMIQDNTQTSIALDSATQSLLTGQENEKRRIAREIHDSIGQALSTVKLHLDFAESKTKEISNKRDLSRISGMISEIASDLRTLSHDLMPSSLIDFGITTAIHNLIKRVNQTNAVYIFFKHNIDDSKVNQNYELNIYRIVQELINNAIKHSDCDEISISLLLENDNIKLIVEDNGIGSSDANINNGIGLFNIKNRLSSINGELAISTGQDLGFKVLINIPYK